MKAAVLPRNGDEFELQEMSDPEPGPGEVLVQVRAAGVCHSDIHMRLGEFEGLPPYFPWIMGHENAGHVAGLGPGASGVSIGEPVVVYGGWGCGVCRLCLSGDEQLCDRSLWAGIGRPGGYAQYICVPSTRHLVPIGELDPTLAAPLTDAGLTPYRAVKRFLPHLVPGAIALIIGAGGLGQFAVQYVKLLTAARVVALDISEPKLERAAALGADLVLDASLPNVAEEIRNFAGNSGVAVVLDHVGSNETLQVGAASVGPRGVIVQVGLAGGGLWFSHTNLPIEVSATYSWWGNRLELEEVVALARQGALEVTVERYPLEAINEVFQSLASGNVMGRAILLPHAQFHQ